MCDNTRECRAARRHGFAKPTAAAPVHVHFEELEDALLAALHGPAVTAAQLARGIRANENEIAAVLWALQRRGVVRATRTDAPGLPQRAWELAD